MVVGFTTGSDRLMAGSSSGKPPAWNTPRFTSSTRCLKCEWHWFASLQVFTTAITGLPTQSAGA